MILKKTVILVVTVEVVVGSISKSEKLLRKTFWYIFYTYDPYNTTNQISAM